jgi:UDPglucose--hexose-1-phosphate uridylyltransferase
MDQYIIIDNANLIFGVKDWGLYFSPGRVNLIGEHLDYNGGNVLPCSISLGITGVITIRNDRKVNCYSESFKELGVISFTLDQFQKEHNWCDYIKGVIQEINIPFGFDLYISSTLPKGAGLSSSASLEVLMATMLNQEFELGYSRLEIIKIAQKAENNYLGIMCGIMDQFAIGMAKENYAILLNTSTLNYEYVLAAFGNYELVIANTNKLRTLSNSKYNERFRECQTALDLLNQELKIKHLCDLDELNEYAALINDEVILKRTKHVVTENQRVKLATKCLENGDLEGFGKLMDQSHISLRDDYEVSCYELNVLVDLFKKYLALGARMTGAGFGGCMVALIPKDQLRFLDTIKNEYFLATNLNCEFYLTTNSRGTHKIAYDINTYVNELINYGISNLILDPDDYEYAVNLILENLHLETFVKKETANRAIEAILDDISNYACLHKIISDGILSIDNFKAKIMDCLMDRPKTVNNKFLDLMKIDSILATNYLYNLSKQTDYIQTKRINKNITWDFESKYAKLIMTINLSKPEKDPKQIARLLTEVVSDYPKCQLCKENIGFSGTNSKESRRNLRAIKLKLNQEDWYFQYSPYAYFNEHAIVFSEHHVPMIINDMTFKKLVEFTNLFPNYFVGSNADLPIVGGSILSHEHFQAGNSKLPIEDAKMEYIKSINQVKLYRLIWPLSVIRLISQAQDDLLRIASIILHKWQKHEDYNLEIINSPTLHNTITPICRFKKGEWIMDLILRNNFTTEAKPWGVFHPNVSLHHIKKENIGLIEAMGLAVLPGRLKKELDKIILILLGNNQLIEDEDMKSHIDWINELKQKQINQDIKSFVYFEVGKVFEQVLEDAGVFKQDKIGTQEFTRFINSI